MSGSKSSSSAAVTADFERYYLQRATQEFAEDLDKIRNADDFRKDGVSMLVHALKQGADIFTPEEQKRVVTGAKEDRR